MKHVAALLALAAPGMAAAIAHKNSTTLRGGCGAHLDQLNRLMSEGVGKEAVTK